MSASVRNLLIVLGILVGVVVYQLLFTDTYEGLFGIPAERITAEAPDIPTIATSPAPTPPGATSPAEELGTGGPGRAEVDGVEPRETPDFPPALAPTTNGQFRSDQLLQHLPTENPFSSLERQRSALFDPFANLPASTLGDFELTDGGEFAELTPGSPTSEQPGTGTGPTTTNAAIPGTPAETRTPTRLPSAPVARLREPTVTVGAPVFSAEFEPLFAPLASTPLITAVRATAVPQDEIRLSRLPTEVLPQLNAPRAPTPALASAAMPQPLPYFELLPEQPPLRFVAGSAQLGARGTASSPGVTKITNLRKYFSDIAITFTGTARGSVTVGVFRSNLALGPVVLAVGQTLPETDITLTRLTTTEAEFTLGEETRVLTLNLGW